MIRREILRADGSPQWLLISQVEHARLSGVLAEHCLSHFSAVATEELLPAIVHHDDGWVDWEAAPTFDEQGRPRSFRELPLSQSLPIWSASIQAAAKIGPLAAATVASHFLALLGASDRPKVADEFAVAWQQEMTARRDVWIASWQQLNPQQNTAAVADEALRWLQLFDVMSLWLCGVCPGADEQMPDEVKSYHVGIGEPLETKFFFADGKARIKPWRFDVPTLELVADASLVPIGEYTDAGDLMSACRSYQIRWIIEQAGRPN